MVDCIGDKRYGRGRTNKPDYATDTPAARGGVTHHAVGKWQHVIIVMYMRETGPNRPTLATESLASAVFFVRPNHCCWPGARSVRPGHLQHPRQATASQQRQVADAGDATGQPTEDVPETSTPGTLYRPSRLCLCCHPGCVPAAATAFPAALLAALPWAIWWSRGYMASSLA